MRRLMIACAGAAALLLAGQASAADLVVEADESKIVRLPMEPTGLIIGNSAIADAVIHNGRALIVSGHYFGRTTITALGPTNQVIAQYDVHVMPRDEGAMSLLKGAAETEYQCLDRCYLSQP